MKNKRNLDMNWLISNNKFNLLDITLLPQHHHHIFQRINLTPNSNACLLDQTKALKTTRIIELFKGKIIRRIKKYWNWSDSYQIRNTVSLIRHQSSKRNKNKFHKNSSNMILIILNLPHPLMIILKIWVATTEYKHQNYNLRQHLIFFGEIKTDHMKII